MVRRFSTYGVLLALELLAGCGGQVGTLDGTRASDAAADGSVRHPSESGTNPPVRVVDSGVDSRGAVPDSAAGEDAHRHAADSGLDANAPGSEAGHDARVGPKDAGMDGGPRDAGSKPDATDACVPRTCAQLGYDCGPAADGCGNVLDCGTCATGQGCGVDGVAGQCSSCAGTCVPLTCEDVGAYFGPVSDGCGNVLDCGGCYCLWNGLPQSCWGAVTDPPHAWLNMDCCGHAVCTPTTCGELQFSCGWVPDGCGDSMDCGACNADGTCPMGGQAGDCAPCQPKTCDEEGFNCGDWNDGCGGMIDCGTCDPCIPCAGGVCAGVFVSYCVPKTCADLGLECGSQADGCGGVLDCGTCEGSVTCAGGACLPACM